MVEARVDGGGEGGGEGEGGGATKAKNVPWRMERLPSTLRRTRWGQMGKGKG